MKLPRLLPVVLAVLLLCACAQRQKTLSSLKLEDGSYSVAVTLSGGSGRATVQSPAKLEVEEGNAYITIRWSSPFFDYMVVDGVRYEFLSNQEGSEFRFPVTVVDSPFPVTADTVAMSTPHEIEYTLLLDSKSIRREEP